MLDSGISMDLYFAVFITLISCCRSYEYYRQHGFSIQSLNATVLLVPIESCNRLLTCDVSKLFVKFVDVEEDKSVYSLDFESSAPIHKSTTSLIKTSGCLNPGTYDVSVKVLLINGEEVLFIYRYLIVKIDNIDEVMFNGRVFDNWIHIQRPTHQQFCNTNTHKVSNSLRKIQETFSKLPTLIDWAVVTSEENILFHLVPYGQQQPYQGDAALHINGDLFPFHFPSDVTSYCHSFSIISFPGEYFSYFIDMAPTAYILQQRGGGEAGDGTASGADDSSAEVAVQVYSGFTTSHFFEQVPSREKLDAGS